MKTEEILFLGVATFLLKSTISLRAWMIASGLL